MNHKTFVFVALIISLFFINSFLTFATGGRGYFMLGPSFVNIDKLNSRLESNNLPKFDNNLFSFGGGGHATIGKLIIGGEGHGLIARDVSNSNYTNSLSCGYGLFNLGYNFLSFDNFDFYGLLGFGGGGYELNIIEKNLPEFDELLKNPKRMVKLSNGGFVLAGEIGLDYIFDFGPKKEDVAAGILLGIRIGYTYAPFMSEWMVESSKITGGPDLPINGFFIRFLIGGGAKTKK